LGSTNGTIVNGERITGQVILKTGDRLQIGKLQFEVVVHEPQSVIAAPTEPPPTFPQKLGDQDSSLSGETVVDFAASQAAPSSSETIVNLHQADTKETTVIPASSGKPKPVLPAVRLPDPSETGAPLAQMPGSQGGKPAGSGDDPRNSAADIIRQFRQMRPR
jgi:predicted component of type VI protein secretion system